jgi:DNA-binding NarL/FixJ family response regulator
MKYTFQDFNEVHALRREGYQVKEIAELMEMPTGTVGSMLTSDKYLEKFGMTAKPRIVEVKREKNHSKAILIMFCDGKRKIDIANTLSLPVEIVNTIIDNAIELGQLQQKWVINA